MNKVSVALRGIAAGNVAFPLPRLRPPSRAKAQQFPVATKTLKNGMKWLVQNPITHSIPQRRAVHFLSNWFRATSIRVPPGFPHFFEHMMFNGAKKYGAGDLDKGHGGEWCFEQRVHHAERTVYQDWFSAVSAESNFR